MDFTHIGLVLPDIRQAEDFYRSLFGMEVVCREAITPAGWKTLDQSIGWERANELGLDIAMIVLAKLPFALAIERSNAGEVVAPSHTGLFIAEPAFSKVKTEVLQMGLPYKSDIPQRFVFTDPFQVWWEITSDTKLYTARDRGAGWIDADGQIRKP
jgi:catechol 2,3-dioxygenase-like lactoylglutathione lyase family enzyme